MEITDPEVGQGIVPLTWKCNYSCLNAKIVNHFTDNISDTVLMNILIVGKYKLYERNRVQILSIEIDEYASLSV